MAQNLVRLCILHADLFDVRMPRLGSFFANEAEGQ
jgi:hypothetical protein